MSSTPPGPFERCAPESADHRCARRGPDRREGTRRAAGRSPALINEALTKHGRFNEVGLNVLASRARCATCQCWRADAGKSLA
jgi:hypothetical protein